MSGPDIFISYSREDRPAARHFAECFTRAGFDVWWDAALRSGETFDEVIEKELRAAKAVVVLWSPRSVASRWVRAEATLADRFNKLVPVIIESCNLPIIFELTHATDLSDWTGDETDARWATLTEDIRRLVGVREEQPQRSANDDHAATPAPDVRDEMLAALERLSKVPRPDLSKPTVEEAQRAEFFKRSDDHREQEGDTVHCLQRLDGQEQVTRFAITSAGLRIGRTAPADIIVPGAGVSRAHCLVELSGDKVRVTDLNSTNGTFIDNKRIERSVPLAEGSILRVGNVSFEHEVRRRSVIEQPAAPAGINPGPIPPEARLTGSS